MAIELIFVVAAVLVVLSIIASTFSNQTGIPALLLFLAIGMLAGSDGPGRIYFEDAGLAQAVGVAALTLILFSGGLDTDWQRIRPVLLSGLALANLGVLISAGVLSVFAVAVLGLSPLEGLLLGAIVSSTDAAAVFSVMRTREVNLKGNIEPLIEFESGSNDPIAVFLTIGLTTLLVTPTDSGLLTLVPRFIVQMGLGAILGFAMGHIMVWLINRMRLRQEGLYPVLTLALVLLTYGATALLGGNGFLAIYIAGLVMGNQNFVHKRSLMRFHDGLAWLMQITMFLTLGLLVYPSRLFPIIGVGLLAALFLTFVARPISVFLALALSKFSFREKLLVSWGGLRGAVPIVMATFPLLAGVPSADLIFNLVYFIVLSSVLLQGSTISWVARKLDLQLQRRHEYHYPQEFVPNVTANSQLIELQIREGSTIPGRMIMELGLPSKSLVVSIDRDGESVIPSGGTVLEAGDRVLLLAEKDVIPEVKRSFQI